MTTLRSAESIAYYKLVQKALADEGHDIGQSKHGAKAFDGIPGPLLDAAVRAFQTANNLHVDGIIGPKTKEALFGLPAGNEVSVASPAGSAAPTAPATVRIPSIWLPPAAHIKGIIVHWTAGANKATEFDRGHYHFLINDDGKLIRGIPTVDMNGKPLKPGYAAHTLGCNTGYIGVSLACMGDFKNPSRVRENPFVAGPYPMTQMQWDALPYVLADLCTAYGINPTPTKVLSHAEVQDTLKIKQRGKWDITRLAFDPSVVGAKACGDIFRKRTKDILAGCP